MELQPRQAQIDRLALVDVHDGERSVFEADCGKGTYVRALARDLGRALGCLGHVAALRRTRVGPLRGGRGGDLRRCERRGRARTRPRLLLPVEAALGEFAGSASASAMRPV